MYDTAEIIFRDRSVGPLYFPHQLAEAIDASMFEEWVVPTFI